MHHAGGLDILDCCDVSRFPIPLAKYFIFQGITVTLLFATIWAYGSGTGQEWDEGRAEGCTSIVSKDEDGDTKE